jgi:cobalt-zinc-cadmium efflux system outer membrane protein
MLLGIFQLLETKQAEVQAYRAYVESVRDYWDARIDLERAVGGRIAPPPAPRSSIRLKASPAIVAEVEEVSP